MSFREAKDTLALLGCGNISVSKLRKETLRVGEAALAELRKPGKDVRKYPAAKLRTPDGARRVPRTLVVMADGTNPPCTKADTAGARGKDSAQAKSRQLRVTEAGRAFCSAPTRATARASRQSGKRRFRLAAA